MSTDPRPHDSHGPEIYARHYVPARPTRPMDRSALRPVLFGASVVMALELATQLLAVLAGLGAGYYAVMAQQLLMQLVLTAIFSAGAAVTGIYFAPLTLSLGPRRTLGRVAIGGELLGRTGAGIVNTALFALGVMIARALPATPSRSGSVSPRP